MKRRLLCVLLALLTVLPLCLASCQPKNDQPGAENSAMSVEELCAFADHGRDVILSDLTPHRYYKYGNLLYEFPLIDERFSLWTSCNPDVGMLDYLMVSTTLSEETLYIYCRDAASLAEGQPEYTGPNDGDAVRAFINRILEETAK